MNRQIWIYDIEVFPNYHCSTWFNIDTFEKKQFQISIFQNDYLEYRDFCLSQIKGIGFNNLAYDYPMLDFLFTIVGDCNYERSTKLLFMESQRLINSIEPKFNRIRNPLFEQIDLFTISHFDNKAKKTSLKQLEIVLELDNVEDLPFHYSKEITTPDEIQQILDYNYNDVYATYQYFLKIIPKIRLRQDIIEKTNLNCINWSDSKLGEQLFLYNYCEETGERTYEVNQRRTKRDYVEVKNILHPIKFKLPNLIELYEKLKEVTIYNDVDIIDSLSYSVVIKDLTLNIKKGGIHGSLKGIFKKTTTHSIIDVDVAGQYPNLYVFLKAIPAHLDKNVFIKVAKQLIAWRKINKDIAKSDKNAKNISDTYKLALNSVYGKFKDAYSWLYDIECTFKVTINGQLFLLALLELISTLDDCQIIQANTDGITIYINNKEIENFRYLYKSWERAFSMELEEVEYKSMWIRDVNHYFAQLIDNKMKFKGAYVPDFKSDSTPDPYHKDYSNQISRLACIDYFINNSDPMTYIKNCQDIKRFSLKQRCNRGDKFILSHYTNGKIETTDLNRTVRFYVAMSYKRIAKHFAKGTVSRVIAGYNVEIINKLPDEFPNDIDYIYYLEEAKKLITDIEGSGSKHYRKTPKDKHQLNLF